MINTDGLYCYLEKKCELGRAIILMKQLKPPRSNAIIKMILAQRWMLFMINTAHIAKTARCCREASAIGRFVRCRTPEPINYFCHHEFTSPIDYIMFRIFRIKDRYRPRMAQFCRELSVMLADFLAMPVTSPAQDVNRRNPWDMVSFDVQTLQPRH